MQNVRRTTSLKNGHLYDYLVVIHIPFAIDHDGARLTGDMWIRDLRGMARNLGRITVAAPCMPVEELTPQRAGSFAFERVGPDDPDIEFLPLPYYESARSLLAHLGPTLRTLDNYIRRARVVHVDTGGWPIPQGELAFLVSRRHRKPTLLFLGDGADPVSRYWEKMHRDRSWLKKLSTLGLLGQFCGFAAWASRRSHLVFFHNPVTGKRFSRFARRHVTLPRTFVEREMLLSQEEASRKLALLQENRPVRCMMAGRLIPMKGVDHAVEAIRRARSLGHDIELTIVGDGSERARLERQVEDAGLNEVIRFAGQVEYGRPVFDLITQHDVMIVCNLTREISRNVLLALAHGCVLVGYENEGTATVVRSGDNGLLCAQGEIDGLVDALSTLARDRSLAQRLARQGLETARQLTFEDCHARRAGLVRECLPESVLT